MSQRLGFSVTKVAVLPKTSKSTYAHDILPLTFINFNRTDNQMSIDFEHFKMLSHLNSYSSSITYLKELEHFGAKKEFSLKEAWLIKWAKVHTNCFVYAKWKHKSYTKGKILLLLYVAIGAKKLVNVAKYNFTWYSLVPNVTHVWLIWHMWFNKPM